MHFCHARGNFWTFHCLNPRVIEAMKEKGGARALDLSRNVPIMLTPEMINGASRW